MTFTETVYIETKNDHFVVDRHPFVQLMRENNEAAEKYIEFNKQCIFELQKTLVLQDSKLQAALHRDIPLKIEEHDDKMIKLLKACSKYPLEHMYMFILGLMMGGKMLKRYIAKDHHSFLTFDDPERLATKLREYLNRNVVTRIDQDKFIRRVKESYKLIKLCFDVMYLECIK